MKAGKKLAVTPEAGTLTVERLVKRVVKGQVRIPAFQRPLQWGAIQVVALFDSIYKGYPIGSLLLQKRAAPAELLSIGPLTIQAPDTPDAFWVVDGQQRLISLAAGLARKLPVPEKPIDAYVVYFDAQNQTFASPPYNGSVPSTWVPVAQLFDSAVLSEWVYGWQHVHDAELRGAVFEAGQRLREYNVPLYTIETEDEEVLRDIFNRTNTYGKKMSWPDVHAALFGNKGKYPSTLPQLAEALEAEKMGSPTLRNLLTYVMASRGLDASRTLAEHERRGDEAMVKMEDAVHDALPVIVRALNFLRQEAEIPHVKLLPLALPMAVLTRYFSLFPHPSERSLELLTRWTWRVLLGGALFDERTILRHGVLTLEDGNDEMQAQKLLRLIPHELPGQLRYALPTRFDARAAESRLALLGMYSLQPLLDTGEPVDLAELLASRKKAGLRTIIPAKASRSELMTSPANRMLLPGTQPTNEQQDLFEEDEEGQYQRGISYEQLRQLNYADNKKFLASHAIDEPAFAALQQGDAETFLQRRRNIVQTAVRNLGDRLAAWGQPDRVSIDQIVAKTLQAE
ncbi:DUF262 domain-containing protein [Hymenobacter aquaticus]|uniref:DUF262 domain-containing protein n=1 Tax=Hymenobacter aquaticus TaxID=1867101 RepID=A0A4Z0Q5N4_9BACT|nr:DUF262 domain-containing protein [Hymenobacter aquaticus]TGE24453.1 DUF262 domain-containing protein [Hymenobacter aquaticus]